MAKPRIELIARGVMIRQGKLLVCENVANKYIFLPGGHVEFGESAESALIREMDEETGAAVKVGRFLGVFEASFEQARTDKPPKRHHEINLVYEMSTETDGPIVSIESKIAFRWVSIAGHDGGLVVRPEGILGVALGESEFASAMSV